MQNKNIRNFIRRRKKMRFRRRMNVPRSVFPSTFTVLNMVCGYASIVMSSEERFLFAAWFIVLAGFFDAIDGLVARLTSSASEFGVELDSLSDLVSFGAAPAFLIYSYGLSDYKMVGFGLSSLVMVACGLRLARFNVQLSSLNSKESFVGLPTPTQALTIASFIATMLEYFQDSEFKNDILIVLSLSLSILMVSKIKYDPLPKFTLSYFRKNPTKTSFYTLGGVLIASFQAPAFLFVLIVYIFFGIGSALVKLFSHKLNQDTDNLFVKDITKT